MYDNIGEKIKRLAKTIFIVEAIVSVIVGVTLWIEIEEWWCAIILFCGPIIAWVSSWLLYGFGELIEKTSENEQNSHNLYKLLKQSIDAMPKNLGTISSTSKNQEAQEIIQKNKSDSKHKWRCSCGNMRSETPCEFCGKSD